MDNWIKTNKITSGIIAAVLVVAAVLIFVAVSGGDSTEKADKKPAAAAPAKPKKDNTALTQSQREQVFVSVIHKKFPESADDTDETIVATGYQVCRAIDAGATLQDFVDEALKNNIAPEDFGFVVGAAVSALCPEHEDFLEQNGLSDAV